MQRPPVRLALGLLLRRSHQRAATALNEALTPLGLTGRHFGVLLILDRDGMSTQRDLIRETHGDKAGMARTIADLDTLGYLDRSRSSTDRRVDNLALSDAGTAAFQAARGLARGAGERLFAAFSDDELDTLAGLLQKFIADDTGAQAGD